MDSSSTTAGPLTVSNVPPQISIITETQSIKMEVAGVIRPTISHIHTWLIRTWMFSAQYMKNSHKSSKLPPKSNGQSKSAETRRGKWSRNSYVYYPSRLKDHLKQSHLTFARILCAHRIPLLIRNLVSKSRRMVHLDLETAQIRHAIQET